MMDNHKDALAWLQGCCAKINELEESAASCINSNDSEGYVRCMQEKARFLAELVETGATFSPELGPETRTFFEQGLERFSSSAKNALALHSTFYMSALLFPEDHKPGQPNDLDTFVRTMQQKIESSTR